MTIDLDQLREGWDFEAKRAGGADGRGALPNSFWESYCAMANAHGGKIVLGVAENRDGSFEVYGIQAIEKVKRDLWTTLENPEKVSINLLTQADVEDLEVQGKTILVITIPQAERRQRPVYLNRNPLTGTYIRIHEGDSRAKEATVKRMLADADARPQDSATIPRFGLDDLCVETLDSYRNIFHSHAPGHPFLEGNTTEFLRQLGAIRKNRETGTDELTEAGLLMFGKSNSLQEYLPSFFVDYRQLPCQTEEEAELRWIDRLVPDGTWPGNLFSFYRRVITKLTQDLKVPFRLEKDLRRDESRVHEAVREAFVNALVHADYHGRGGVRIFRHPEHFEFLNPGRLLLSVEQMKHGGRSECRNPTLQRLFRMAGIGEQAGSGVPSILRAWRTQHWRVPAIQENLDGDETRVELTMLSLFPEGVVDDLRARFGDGFEALSQNERVAVATAKVEGAVSNRRLQELVEAHPHDLTAALRGLVSAGFLVPHGEAKGRWYSVVGSSSHHSGPSSHHSGPSSQHNVAKLPESMKKVAGTKRTSERAIGQAIVDFCGSGPQTLPQIAQALARSEATVRNRYLPSLIKAGRLHLVHPSTPNHPNQAYVSPDLKESKS